MAKLIKNNEMAAMLGMSAPAFSQGVKNGRFSIASKDKNGENLFDPEIVFTEFQNTKDTAKMQNHAQLLPKSLQGGKPTGSTSSEGNDTTAHYLQIKIAKDGYIAKLKELEYKVKLGEVIDKSEVQRVGARLGEIMVGTINSWTSRLSSTLANMQGKDEHDFRLLLEKETNDLIVEIRAKCGFE